MKKIMTNILLYTLAIIYSPISLLKIFTSLIIILDEWSGDIIKEFIKENTDTDENN